MADLTRGYTFGSTEEVTNSKLHALVDDGSVSNITASDFNSGVGPIVRSTSAPSNTSAIWVDTNASPPVAKHYDGSEWVATGPYAVLTNKSGGARSAGDVVVADTTTDGAFTTTTTASDKTVLGVVLQSIADNADGVVALAGARVKNIAVTAATSRGDFLFTSTTAGSAVPNSSPGTGAFAIALDTTAGAGALGEAILIGTSVSGDSLPSHYRDGMNCKRAGSSTTITVNPGLLEVDGAEIEKTADITLTLTTAGDWATGSSAQATSTYGFIGVDKSGNVKMYTTAPTHSDYALSNTSGKKRYVSWNSTTYRVIGWFYMNDQGSGELYTYEVGNLKEFGINNAVENSDQPVTPVAITDTTYSNDMDVSIMHIYTAGGPLLVRGSMSPEQSDGTTMWGIINIDSSAVTNSEEVAVQAVTDGDKLSASNPSSLTTPSQGTHTVKMQAKVPSGTFDVETWSLKLAEL